MTDTLTSNPRFPDPEKDLFSDAMDAAASVFHSVRHGILRNAERAGETTDGEVVVRRSIAAAFNAYVRELRLADEPSTDQSDIDFLAATLVDQESVLDECEKLLKESLAEDGVECGFDRRLEQYWQKRKALADWRSRELRLAEPPTSRLLLVPCPRCFGTGKLKPYKREGDTDWRIDDCPEKHVTAQPPTSAQSSGHEPYWTRSFWSPCREYLLSVHSYGEREIVAIDDNGDEWEATGPAQDIAGDAVSLLRQSSTKDAGECGACDKPGEHCANVHGICSRHGGRAHETEACRQCHARPCICVEFQK